MSDPDRSRPAVPDPQQDHHVSFPEETPPEGPTTFGSTLPPEAWAPRPSTHGSSSSASPTRSQHPAPPPAILTTPPVRPEPRRRRRWPALLLVPLLLHALANGQSSGSMTDGCVSYPDAQTGVSDCGSYGGTGDGGAGEAAPADWVPVWTEDVTASTEPLGPLLKGSPKVSPVPADATVLRVEVVSTGVSDPPAQVQIDTTAGGTSIDAWGGDTPHALDVHLDDRPTDLTVSVLVTTGSATVQCRVYSGSTLVAVDTSTKNATCSPAL